MIKLSLLFICCSMVMGALGQQSSSILNVSVKNEKSKQITILKPVNNAVFWPARQSVQLDENGFCTVRFDSTETGFVILLMQGRRINLFIKQGDTIQLSVDTGLVIAPVSFKGNNTPGQILLNDNDMPVRYEQVEKLFVKDSSFQQFIEHVEREKNTKINLIGKIYDERKIDSNFFSFVKMNLDYLYATVIVRRISNAFYGTVNTSTNPNQLLNFPKEYAEYWDMILQYYPPDNERAIQLPSMENYVDNYVDAYLGDYRRWLIGDTVRQSRNDYVIMKLNVIRKNMKGRMSDLTEARRLALAYIQQKFENPLIDFYSDYARRTGLPKYLSYLLPYHKEVVAYHATADNQFDTKKIFIKEQDKINKFDELKERLKGNFYYVDIWATWCGPCKAEFAYKEALHDFFTVNKIKTLYISMDVKDRDADWKTMIKYYKLDGVHIRTNDALRNDLSDIFWGGNGGYSIPLYLLIGPDGTVLEKDAFRPSDPEKLKAQISKYLK